MKKIVLLLSLCLLFVAGIPPAHAYLTDVWTQECGTLEHRNQAWFLKGYRIYSRANWRELLPHIGKKVCVEGYIERSNTTHRMIGISFHAVYPETASPATAIHSAASETAPAGNTSSYSHRVELVGVLQTDLLRRRTYLRLANGNKLIMEDFPWDEAYINLSVLVEGTISADGRVTSISNASFKSFDDLRREYPPTR